MMVLLKVWLIYQDDLFCELILITDTVNGDHNKYVKLWKYTLNQETIQWWNKKYLVSLTGIYVIMLIIVKKMCELLITKIVTWEISIHSYSKKTLNLAH